MATRFCPSPTGLLHIGNVRTALFNFAAAERMKMPFLLRVEDTDRERCQPQYQEALLEDLRWLGLEWQGEIWHQSERGAIYGEYMDRLRLQGQLYRCFCSDEALQLQRQAMLAAGMPPRYAGTCLKLSADEVAAKQAAGEGHAWRFRVPAARLLPVPDLVRETYEANTDLLGDFVLERRDGEPTFLFCNALDDALSGVRLALRGDDHIANTPKQLLLLEALGLQAPQYGHLALLTDADHHPLSKRDASTSVRAMRQHGYLPEALLNQVFRLGHSVAEPCLMAAGEMAKELNMDAISRAPAIWTQEGLKHWQKLAVEGASVEALADWLAPVLPALPDGVGAVAMADFLRDNLMFPGEAAPWVGWLFGEPAEYSDEALTVLRAAGGAFFQQAAASWPSAGGDWNLFVKELGQQSGRGGRKLFLPLRVALCGQGRGPELERMAALMGGQRVGARLAAAGVLVASS